MVLPENHRAGKLLQILFASEVNVRGTIMPLAGHSETGSHKILAILASMIGREKLPQGFCSFFGIVFGQVEDLLPF